MSEQTTIEVNCERVLEYCKEYGREERGGILAMHSDAPTDLPRFVLAVEEFSSFLDALRDEARNGSISSEKLVLATQIAHERLALILNGEEVDDE